MKPSYQQQLIREELEAHVADLADELIAQGMDEAAARTQAATQFGDVVQIEQAVASLHHSLPWLPWRPHVLLIAVYTVGLIILSSVLLVLFSSVEGTYTETIAVYWLYGAAIGLGVLLSYWLTDFFGWNSFRGIFATACVVQLLALALTVVFDIDKFETNIHALAFSAFILVLAKLLWSHLRLIVKQFIVYGHAVVVLYSIVYHEPLFQFIAKPGCWFITQDVTELTGALAACMQVQPTDAILYPLYGTLLTVVGYLSWVMIRYWRNAGTKLHRKVILSVSCAGMIVAPLAIHDLNDRAELDVIPYKPAIYSVYEDILGRQPTSDEVGFYATTRSYEHMNKLTQVLYESDERRIKINQLYSATLQRATKPKEIDRHNAAQDSIAVIQAQLDSKKTQP